MPVLSVSQQRGGGNTTVWPAHRQSTVVMIGAFPPPVHGLSAINQAVNDLLLSSGAQVVKINLSLRTLNRSALALLMRGVRAVIEALKLILVSPQRYGSTFYIGLSGGFGQVYDLLFVLLIRLMQGRLIMHHHSYAYLTRKSFLTSLLTLVAGKRATHIVLSGDMRRRLNANYKTPRQVIVLSNIAFMLPALSSNIEIRQRPCSIGFLGNISATKGIDLFLDTVARLRQAGCDFQAVIAGPFSDVATERRVLARVSALSNVKYIGPVYGEEKELFFSEIDVLLFPSLYINEAEPITIHEAMAAGVPVIATSRGSIPEILSNNGGLVIAGEADYVQQTADQLTYWANHPDRFARQSQQTLLRSQQLRRAHQDKLKRLLDSLVTKPAHSEHAPSF